MITGITRGTIFRLYHINSIRYRVIIGTGCSMVYVRNIEFTLIFIVFHIQNEWHDHKIIIRIVGVHHIPDFKGNLSQLKCRPVKVSHRSGRSKADFVIIRNNGTNTHIGFTKTTRILSSTFKEVFIGTIRCGESMEHPVTSADLLIIGRTTMAGESVPIRSSTNRFR